MVWCVGQYLIFLMSQSKEATWCLRVSWSSIMTPKFLATFGRPKDRDSVLRCIVRLCLFVSFSQHFWLKAELEELIYDVTQGNCFSCAQKYIHMFASVNFKSCESSCQKLTKPWCRCRGRVKLLVVDFMLFDWNYAEFQSKNYESHNNAKLDHFTMIKNLKQAMPWPACVFHQPHLPLKTGMYWICKPFCILVMTTERKSEVKHRGGP